MKTMKKALVLLAALFLICVAGCAPKTEESFDFSQPMTCEPQYVTQWPENRFTAEIPKVEAGTVDYVLDDAENDRYAVFMKDISDEESGAYIQQLVEAGYDTVASADDKVVLGKMLHKDDVWLSISAGENMLGIMVAISR